MISQVGHLVQAGFGLHWLHPKSKRPIGDDWSMKPVATLDRLRQTYKTGNNVGVRLGKWSHVGGAYLHIIDMDIRKASLRAEALRKLEDVFPELYPDRVPTVISGSGGESRHFYILSPVAYPSRKFAHSDTYEMVWDDKLEKAVKKWDWELHLLGTGAQAAIPPSIHPDTGLQYRWEREFDFADLDMGLADTIPADVLARVIGYEEPSTVDPERAKPLGLTLDEAESILMDIPFRAWFEDRDGWLNTGMALHHEFAGSKEAFNLWCRYSRKSEKYDLEDSKRVWRSFKNRSARPFRMASLKAVANDERIMREFDDVDTDFDDLGGDAGDMFEDLLGESAPAEPEKERDPTKSQLKLKKEDIEIGLGRGAPEWVANLNERHAIARVSSKTVVMDFQPDGSVTYGSVTDLHNFYENDRRPKDVTTVPVTKLWIQHKQRREYPKGIVFAPNRDIEGAYNHWQGFSVEAEGTPEDCKLFLDHLKEVFCNGDDRHYWYTLRWMAHMIQKPEDKPGVALVARGKKRIGKDTVFEYFGRIIDRHYITVGNQEQMLGKFNAHQEKVLLLHMQEGYWAGDRKAEGQLKYLITSHDVMIEPKGMNAFRIRSVLRLFISSNEQWVVPATADEGRYFVLNVSDKRKGDYAYFDALRAEMYGKGPSALLNYLQGLDLRGFQIRNVPDTEALAEQKVQGLKNVQRWWHGVLQHGSIENAQKSDGVGNNIWIAGYIRVDRNDLRENYSRWMRTRRFDGEEVSEIEFTKRLQEMVPQLAQARPGTGTGRTRVYVLPDLDVCRRGFEQMLGSELLWPEAQLDEADDDDEGDDLG